MHCLFIRYSLLIASCRTALLLLAMRTRSIYSVYASSFSVSWFNLPQTSDISSESRIFRILVKYKIHFGRLASLGGGWWWRWRWRFIYAVWRFNPGFSHSLKYIIFSPSTSSHVGYWTGGWNIYKPHSWNIVCSLFSLPLVCLILSSIHSSRVCLKSLHTINHQKIPSTTIQPLLLLLPHPLHPPTHPLITSPMNNYNAKTLIYWSLIVQSRSKWNLLNLNW